MAGVERSKQRRKFYSSAFAEHEAIGAHAERGSEQLVQVDAPDPFGRVLARFEGDVVRVPQLQLGEVLYRDDAFVRGRFIEQGREEGGFRCNSAPFYSGNLPLIWYLPRA